MSLHSGSVGIVKNKIKNFSSTLRPHCRSFCLELVVSLCIKVAAVLYIIYYYVMYTSSARNSQFTEGRNDCKKYCEPAGP